jgi:hypothetical protein
MFPAMKRAHFIGYYDKKRERIKMGSPVKSRAALTLGRVRLEGTDGGQATRREFQFLP